MKPTKTVLFFICILTALSQLVSAQTIIEAAEKGDEARVRLHLRDDPPSVNMRDDVNGYTALHEAAVKDYPDICRLLLDHGADINAIDSSQQTPLHLTAQRGHLEVAALLIEKGADVHRKDGSGGTALHIAAMGGHGELFKLLIDSGMDVDAKDNNGYTPLVWALLAKRVKTMEELHKHGASLTPPLRIGRSLLHLAAARGNEKVLTYLLKKDLNVNTASDYGNTPIFWAVRSRNYQNSGILLKHGAKLEVKNHEGRTPASFAISSNDIRMVEMLAAHGFKLEKPDTSGDTPLHAAAYDGLAEMTTLLLEKGVDPNMANNRGATPLDLAIYRGHEEIQNLLRTAGAKEGKGVDKENETVFEIGEPGSGIEKPLKLTILYDNYPYREEMEADWGFSCYIEGPEKSILFDTGTKGDLLLKHMEKMEVDPQKIEMVVLSHEHGDHTGGLFSLLKINQDLTVLMPFSFSYSFVRNVEAKGAKAIPVDKPLEIAEEVFLNRELNAGMIGEQSLAINTKKGLVIICGCSHPGIIPIVKEFKETLKREIYMVLGGFHLMNKTDFQVKEITDQLKELGVKKFGASHCTGERQIEVIKKEYGENYVQLGVGRVIKI